MQQAKNLLGALPGSGQVTAGSDQARGESRSVRVRAELVFVTSLRLFVYGSLRRGERHHDELSGAEFLGASVTTPSYRVVECGGYPALVPGTAAIRGELYAVPSSLVTALDAFEGAHYRRCAVRLADGSDAEAYFLAEAYGS